VRAGARLDRDARGAVLDFPADVDREREDVRVALLEARLDERHRCVHLLAFAQLDLTEAARPKHRRDEARIRAAIDLRERLAEYAKALGQPKERLAGNRRTFRRAHRETVDALLEEEAIEHRLVLQIDRLLPAPHAVERRLRDVEVAPLDDLRELPV